MTIKLDLGCGKSKRPGYIGIDHVDQDDVDHVVNLEHDSIPFDDRSVDEIYSSHCFEHMSTLANVFREISRVAKEDALLEIWTPFAWSDEGFIYDHKTFFTPLHYLHPTNLFPSVWYEDVINAYWHLEELRYNVTPRVLTRLARNMVRLDFALEHMHNIAWEFCARMRVSHDTAPDSSRRPRITYCTNRASPVREVSGWGYLGVVARLAAVHLKRRVIGSRPG